MGRIIKKAMILFFSLCLLGGCTLPNTKNNSDDKRSEMPAVKPKDFNFVFNYGVGAKNQLDTLNGEYTKDMITEPSITTNLSLSDEEMNSIYIQMKKINILSYPDDFMPKGEVEVKPFFTYSIKIVMNGKEKNIKWEDKKLSETKEAAQLRELFNKIYEIIEMKEEYKKLPKPKGGYD